jgi:hypothetical protein
MFSITLDGKNGKNNFKSAKKMQNATTCCHLRRFWVNFVIFFEKTERCGIGDTNWHVCIAK